MAWVNGMSMARPAMPPMPGRMPRSRPSSAPKARNRSRVGSTSIVRACAAASSMRATLAFFLPGVRIAAGAKLDAQRRSGELEPVPEEPFEVALVGIGHAVERVAVDDDARRVHPALVRVAQLRPDRAALGRRLLLDRGNQRARQL